MSLRAAPAKTQPAKRTGRRYASVADLLVEEQAGTATRANVAMLAAQAVVVRHLTSLRLSAGITQAELAKRMGCTQSRISKIEASSDENLTLGVIHAYVRALEARLGLVIGAVNQAGAAIEAQLVPAPKHG